MALAPVNVLNDLPQLERIETLNQHPDNPRLGNILKIRESIRRLGFYGYVVAQRSTRRILVGNHRWEAARLEGLAEIPVYWVDVDDDRAKMIVLADNRASDYATYDKRALVELLQDLQQLPVGLLGTGFSPADFESIRSDLAEFQREAVISEEETKESAGDNESGDQGDLNANMAVGRLRWFEAGLVYRRWQNELMIRAGFGDREVVLEIKKRLGFAA